ncbi:MAG: pilus assembly protein TadG-related protein [Galactobacter sp.]
MVKRRGDLLARLRGQRGDLPLMTVLLVPVLFLVVALVVDGGGKVKADEEATLGAQSAARAGANAGSQPAPGGAVHLDPVQARAAAHQYLRRNGMSGTVHTHGITIEVTAHTDYQPKLLRFGNWHGTGDGAAQARSS